MIAKYGQTKRAVMIELVLILALVIAYSRMHNPVPAATRISVPPLVATPATVPSWDFSAVPDTKPAQGKAKKPHKAAKSTFAAKPVPVPIVAKTNQDAAEPAPVPAPIEAIIPAPESTAVSVSKPVLANAPETVPVVKEASAPAPGTAPVPVPNEALAMASETTTSPMPKSLPASVLSPQASPSTSTSPATSLVTATTAALVLAPIVAPVAIIVGVVVGIFTPSSSQLGQVKPAPKPKAGIVPNADASSAY